MNEGILVDLPHMSMSVRNEILGIAELTNRPVMISHDNPRSLFDQPFGPETLARIAHSGHGTGLIGVHAYKSYINVQNGLAAYAAAIDDGRKAYDSLPPQLGQGIKGDEHLALGIDWFFHKNMDLRDWAGRDPREPLKGLVAMLMSHPHNYSDQQIKNILGENMIRMLRAAWKE
jgi:microsomal dipeptidase-like Zn-dependent dipeptidase